MRLLVVEDEPDLRTGLESSLRKQGYAVDSAEDGEEGLYKALNTDYDAVILDLMLPKLDGWSVLAGLRGEKKTPVLMLTARDTVTDRVRGLDGGADDYLAKPFDLPELFARLRALIRRTQGAVTTELAVGDVSIDLAARSVTRAGVPVALTAREYGVLVHLAQRRGRVVSRTELHEHVSDERDDTISNLIDVHIFNLRKKLGHEFIATRRGHGYCIE